MKIETTPAQTLDIGNSLLAAGVRYGLRIPEQTYALCEACGTVSPYLPPRR